MKFPHNDYVRTSASVPREHYEQLELLAQKHKVSIAWVVRDAIESYLKEHVSEMTNTKDDRITSK